MDGCRVAVNVNHDPKWRACIDARQKDALILSVDVEHHIATGREVEREEDADVDVAFRQGLTPEAGTARQICFFFRKRKKERCRGQKRKTTKKKNLNRLEDVPGQAYLGRTPLKDAGLHDVKPIRRTPFQEVEHSATRR